MTTIAIVHQPPSTPTIPRDPVLRDTLDKLQTRFECKGANALSILKTWRNAVYVRYMQLLPKHTAGVHNVLWEDFNYDNEAVTLDGYLSPHTLVPDHLAKTIVKIYEGPVHTDENKLIVITVYFRKRRTTGGTCMIQGKRKGLWVRSEYRALCDYVQQLLAGTADPTDNVPVTSNHLASGPDVTESIVTSPATPSNSSRGLLLAVSLADTPITPTLSTPSDNKEVSLLVQPAESSITGDYQPTPLLSDHSSPTNPITTSTGQPLQNARTDFSLVAATVDGVMSTATPLPPTRPNTNASPASPGLGLRNTEAAPTTALGTTCPHEDTTDPDTLRAQLKSACNLITDLRADVSTLFKGLSAALARIDQLESQLRDEAVKRARDLQVTEKSVGEVLSGLDDRITGVETAQHATDGTVNQLSSAKQSHKQRLREIQKQLKKKSATASNNSDVAMSGNTQTDLSANVDICASPRQVTGSAIAAPCHPSPPPVLQELATVQAVSAAEKSPERLIPVRITGGLPEVNNGYDHASSQQQRNNKMSPDEQILRHSVQSDTTTLVIGDSVVRNIKAEKMPTYPIEKVDVLSVSGLRTVHLLNWLQRQHASHTAVALVTFHVGINDCKQKEVTSAVWEQLVRECRRVFPGARLQASSILPTDSRHQLYRAITASNSNLFHVCRKLGVTLIDNTQVFTAVDGLPRRKFYRRGDPIHPSRQGTISLALNIKRGGPATDVTTPNNQPAGGDRHRRQRREGHAGTTNTYANVAAGRQSVSAAAPNLESLCGASSFGAAPESQGGLSVSSAVAPGLESQYSESRFGGTAESQCSYQQQMPGQYPMWQQPPLPPYSAAFPQYREAGPWGHFSMTQPTYPFSVPPLTYTPYAQQEPWAQYSHPVRVY